MDRAPPTQAVLHAARGFSIVEIAMPLLIGLFTGCASVLRFSSIRLLVGISLLVPLLALATSLVTKSKVNPVPFPQARLSERSPDESR